MHSSTAFHSVICGHFLFRRRDLWHLPDMPAYQLVHRTACVPWPPYTTFSNNTQPVALIPYPNLNSFSQAIITCPFMYRPEPPYTLQCTTYISTLTSRYIPISPQISTFYLHRSPQCFPIFLSSCRFLFTFRPLHIYPASSRYAIPIRFIS